MEHFKYKAADRNGKISEVTIEGDSQQDALIRLRNKGYTPVKFLGSADISEQPRQRHFWESKDIDPGDFTNRLVPLLNANIPLERALGIIEEGMDNEKAKAAVKAMRRNLHEGKKFSEIIRARADCFPPIYANMVEAGEESGALTGVMKELQKFLNEDKELKEFLITSSIYPAIILIVTLSVVILLFTVFVPKFATIFMNMGRKLPLLTRIMLAVSGFITGYWWLWIVLIITFIIFLRMIRPGGRLHPWWDETIIKFPVVGNLIKLIEITRFVRTLSVLLQNYVHLLETVKIAQRVIQNSFIVKSLSGTATELKGGAKLSSALSKSPFIHPTVIRMLAIGEETGNMGEMLEKVAEQFEATIKLQVKRMLSLFEPVVILILAVIVLFVVLSVFMAIFEMNQI